MQGHVHLSCRRHDGPEWDEKSQLTCHVNESSETTSVPVSACATSRQKFPREDFFIYSLFVVIFNLERTPRVYGSLSPEP